MFFNSFSAAELNKTYSWKLMFAGFCIFCCSLNSVLCEMEVVSRQADSVIRVVPLMVWQMGFQEKRCSERSDEIL